MDYAPSGHCLNPPPSALQQVGRSRYKLTVRVIQKRRPKSPLVERKAVS